MIRRFFRALLAIIESTGADLNRTTVETPVETLSPTRRPQ